MNAALNHSFFMAQHRYLLLFGAASWLLLLSCGGKTAGQLPGGYSDVTASEADEVTAEQQPTVTEATMAEDSEQLFVSVVEPGTNGCADNSPNATCANRLPPNLADRGITPGDEYLLAQAAFENLLSAACGDCHGSQIANAEDAEGGINFIDNFEQLVEAGLIVPGSSKRSQIVEVMRNGSMPPPAQTSARPSIADINAIADFLEHPLYFQGPVSEGCGSGTTSPSYVGAAIDDLPSLPAGQAQFTRYLLVGVQDGPYCIENHSAQSRALLKMLNSLSVENEIHNPPSIDLEGSVYRIDLRDYGWQRSIVVDGVEYSDAWEAIVAHNPYAIAFEGAIAEEVMASTVATVPWMNLTRALSVALQGNLYYALIGVAPEQTLDDLISNGLGIDLEANRLSGRVIRAGRASPEAAGPSTLVERHSALTRTGAFWQRMELGSEDNLLLGADQTPPGARQAIFPLANGMLAYVSSDRLNAIVPNQQTLNDAGPALAQSTVSCTSCHAEGFLSFRNEAQEQLEQDSLTTEEELIYLRGVYPDSQSLAIGMARDSEAYLRDLAQLRIEGSDPLFAVASQFEEPLNLDEVAYELVTSPTYLRDNLQDFPEIFTTLAAPGGQITRAQFTDSFAISRCLVPSPDDFRPLSSLCAQFAQLP